MVTLTNNQRGYLRSMAHNLKPVVQLGKQGLTDVLIAKVDQELNAHELIKVKFLDFQDQKRDFAQIIAERTASTLVEIIGNIAVFYREHADPAEREIILPAP